MMWVAGLPLISTQQAEAVTFTLSDENAIAEFDNDADFGTGFFSWTVDGVEQIVQLSTYIRSDAPNFCSEGFVLIETPECLSSANPADEGILWGLTQNQPNQAEIFYIYQDPISKFDQFRVTLTYTLNGRNGSLLSSLDQKVTIDNLASSSTTQVDILQYYNLILNNTLGDTASIDPNTTTATQVEDEVLLEGDIFGTITTNTVGGNTPADAYQVDTSDNLLFDPISGITSPLFTTLNNDTGPVTGDPAVAYQFNNTFLGDGTPEMVMSQQTIRLEILEIPEPSSMIALVSVTGIGFMIGRRKDK